MTLVLHYAPDNASLCVRLALEEAGLPYQTRLVDRRSNAQATPGFRALNPHGLIPALETPDGPMFETAAILIWLGQNGAAALGGPSLQSPQGLSWLVWLSNTLHPALRVLFYPDKHITDDGIDALTQATRRRVTAMLDRLATEAETRPAWLRAGSATLHSCYLCPMLRWLALYPRGTTDWFDLAGWPVLLDVARSTEARPASARVALAEGLGPTPFSAPSPPNPPEGSAL